MQEGLDKSGAWASDGFLDGEKGKNKGITPGRSTGLNPVAPPLLKT